MTSHEYLSEEQLIRKAVDVLIQKLGPVEASRFISMSIGKREDSVKRHQQWQTQLKKEEFFNEAIK